VPRRINTLCERTLLAIFTRGLERANVWLVRQAAREVQGKRSGSPLWGWSALAAGLAVMGLAAYLFWTTPATTDAGDQGLAAPAVETPEEEPPQPEPPAATVTPVVESPPVEQPAQTIEQTPAPAAVAAIDPPAAEGLTAAEESLATATVDTSIEQLDPARLFSRPQSRLALYGGLYDLWGESFESASPLTPCMQAPSRGLRCLREQGDWEQIEALDRPVLLRLMLEKQSRLLLVKHKQDELLVVDGGQGEALLSTDSLEPFWKGEYTLLWKPHGGVALIGEGSAGEAVTWLRQQLQAFDQQPAMPVQGVDRFDDGLKSRVRAFQRSHGLLQDGLAGQQTLIYINNLAADPDRPSLTAQTGEG
jgi:general secretion pathway protein A